MIAAQDAARKLREDGTTVVSGFQSPVEKECLRILLGGTQPVIISPARGLRTFRLPAEWRQALESGRLLLLSRFEKTRRADKNTARRRNELVAALSDEVFIVHATPTGSVERIAKLVEDWNVPRRQLHSGN
jgi:predicted Rossmann fold nucleotide-binding protein DprA/Smf involved in DNA uptake